MKTLGQEHRLSLLENEVGLIRKIFADKRDEITGEWRILQNVELHALYSSSNIMEQDRNA